MKYFDVKFWDKNGQEMHNIYVYTLDINMAIKLIEKESPQVKAYGWREVTVDELPDLTIAIQK